MKVVLYGATGKAGARILRELLSRGHQVLAVARDPGKIKPESGVSVASDDLSDCGKTAATIKAADAVISAYAPPPDKTDELVTVTQRFVDAVRRSCVPRFLMVGGAGGLEVAPGVSLIDSGHLPAEWLPIAISHVKALNVLRSSDINWTYFAPAAYFSPGERTGKFRLGRDNLVCDADGNSRISMEDYAIAMVDELENPRHPMQRFTIGY